MASDNRALDNNWTTARWNKSNFNQFVVKRGREIRNTNSINKQLESVDGEVKKAWVMRQMICGDVRRWWWWWEKVGPRGLIGVWPRVHETCSSLVTIDGWLGYEILLLQNRYSGRRVAIGSWFFPTQVLQRRSDDFGLGIQFDKWQACGEKSF